jgi:hypothetical protein
MPARTLDAQVRHEPGIAIIDLQGEINGFAEHVLNDAYVDAESQGS